MIELDSILTYRRAGRNPAAKAVRSPVFRQRVVPSHKQYNRAKNKRSWGEYDVP